MKQFEETYQLELMQGPVVHPDGSFDLSKCETNNLSFTAHKTEVLTERWTMQSDTRWEWAQLADLFELPGLKFIRKIVDERTIEFEGTLYAKVVMTNYGIAQKIKWSFPTDEISGNFNLTLMGMESLSFDITSGQGIEELSNTDILSYAQDRKTYYNISNTRPIISGRSVTVYVVDSRERGTLFCEAVKQHLLVFGVQSGVNIDHKELEQGTALEIENLLFVIADSVVEADASVLSIVVLPFVFTEEDKDVCIAIRNLKRIGALVVTVTANKEEYCEIVKSVPPEDVLICCCTTRSGQRSSCPKDLCLFPHWVCSWNENVDKVSTSLTCSFVAAEAATEYLVEETATVDNIKEFVIQTIDQGGYIKMHCPAKFQKVFQEYFDSPQLAVTIKMPQQSVLSLKHPDHSYKLCLICGNANTADHFSVSCTRHFMPPETPAAGTDLMVDYLKEKIFAKFDSLYEKFETARDIFVKKAKSELMITDPNYSPFQLTSWDPQYDTSILEAYTGEHRRPEVQQLADKVRSIGRRYLTSYFGVANTVTISNDRARFEQGYCVCATKVFCFILPLDAANYLGVICGAPSLVRGLRSWAVIGETQRNNREAVFTNFMSIYNNTQKFFSRDSYPDDFAKLCEDELSRSQQDQSDHLEDQMTNR
eukprot:TRINITY_DN7887_c0_g3_i1.p1 TRINITY_DN7887_c0_g3~~TRINITY_DN7887_c0_g3_i1.p1  ORF type:complete len:651 (+),score=87.47 TRINITY_DN7887_c0_g3_i1:723-2675(+)